MRLGVRLRGWAARTMAATAAAAVALIVGTGVPASAHSSRDAANPVSGGSLTYAVGGTQASLDPAVAATAVTGVIDRNVFDSLVTQTGPDSFGPWLATSWKISGGGKIYTFALRKGVKFQDGTSFTAAAVKATLDHVVDPATKSAYASSLIAPYEKSAVLSPYSVRVTLKRAFTPFLQALSVPYLGIQSPAALAKPADQYVPVGTGPFAYVSWVHDQSVVLKRNPAYNSPPANAKHSGAAYLSGLTFRFVSEDATRYGALLNGQVDGIADVPAIDVPKLNTRSGFTVLSAVTPGLNYNLYLNQKNGLLSDVRLRRALSASIDVPSLIKSIYFGAYQPASNPLGSRTADFDPTAKSALSTYNPTKAKQLLDQAGWTGVDSGGYRTKNGTRLTIVWPYWAAGNKQQRDVLAEGIQAQAKRVGIDIQRPLTDTGAFVEDLLKGTFDLIDVSFARPTPDVLRFAFDSTSTYAHGGGNVAFVQSPEIDKLVNEAAATSDPAVAKRDYAQVQKLVLEQAWVLPLYTPVQISGFADRVNGIAFDPQTYPTFYSAWIAK